MLSTLTHAPLVSAKTFNIPPTTISSLDIPGKELSDLKIAGNRSAIAGEPRSAIATELSFLVYRIATGDVSSVELELTMPKNQKPLRKRGAGASIGEICQHGNHIFDELNVPYMHENDSRSYPTPLGLIPQSPSEYRGFRTANLEAQGEVA